MSVAGEPQLVSALPLDPYELRIEENNDANQTESQQIEENVRQWDLFGLSSDEWQESYRTNEYKWLIKLLKILVYLITFCLVLGGAVVSKSSLLLITSLINEDNSFYFYGNLSIFFKNVDRLDYGVVVVKERKALIWCLLFALFMPEVFTFLRSLRICVFKKFSIPRFTTFLVILTTESLHTIGLVLMLIVVFPRIDVLTALTLTNAVCIVPSVLNFLSSWSMDCSKKSVRNTGFDLMVVLFQFTVFLYFILAPQKNNPVELWLAPISCLLISCAWWENFVSDNSKIFARLKNIKDNIEECRHFLYVIIPLWKIGLILASCAAILIIVDEYTTEDINSFFFTDIKNSLTNFNISIEWPKKYGEEIANMTQNDNLTVEYPRIDYVTEDWVSYFPIIVTCVHVASSYLCFISGKFACKICIQGFSYALPVVLCVPTTMCLLYFITGCHKYSDIFTINILPYLTWCPMKRLEDFFIADYSPQGGFTWIFWIISQIWMTHHIWISKTKRMASTSELFVNPLYCTALVDQSLALNRRKEQEIDELLESVENEAFEINREKAIPRILACATMWHETPDEMEQLLKSIMRNLRFRKEVLEHITLAALQNKQCLYQSLLSIFFKRLHQSPKETVQSIRMDNDQCMKRAIKKQLEGAVNKDYYEVESHIFFDDAFVVSDEDDTKMVINNFVKDLIESVNTAASKIYPPEIKLDPPIKVPTPYGGRLIWKLQGENTLVAHLKNKDLIRHKKRWSQVMYMYYLLGYRLMNPDLPSVQRDDLAKNTYILALDGDIDFKPDAVQLLVDLMKRNENLGAACGRIHPVGTGMMVYYQKFEYAIGHWLQKATEHMIGCVLCSPGCFSLFRAEALMQDNVIRRYATQSKEAIEYVQFDQGEDRWLCTLLLQSGSRVEYSAASDAYTHCPESFAEFYTQRRRWAPSTMANIMDLLVNYKSTVECNDNISMPYIFYQLMLMIGSILGPGTIFLMLVGAMVQAFEISNWQSLLANFFPVAFFVLICFVAKNDTQILVAQVFSAAYALLMMAVIVGISLQMVTEGIATPTAIFLLAMTGSFLLAAILHPREFSCVLHGIVYFLSVPSMYLFLTLYSITNLHVVSWGTREVATKKTKKQLEQEKLEAEKNKKKDGGFFDWFGFLSDKQVHEEEDGSITFGLANLFRCMCCTYPKPDASKVHLLKIGEQLENLNSKITNLQRQIDLSISRPLGFRKRSSIHGLTRDSNLLTVAENEEDEDESEQDEVESEHDEHMYNQILTSQNNTDEAWLTDPVLKKSPTWRMSPREESFWKELIEKYLYPLTDNPQEKAKIAAQLIELRNKVVFGILMLNALFILIVFLLQLQKDTLHIEWPFNGKPVSIIYVQSAMEIVIELEFLQLEPINLILVFFFSIIVVIQFVAMLFHRFQTISHILASTELNCAEDSTKPEIMMSQLTDILQQLNLRPDDTVDGEPSTARRRSTICKLDSKRQGRNRQIRSLSVAYEETIKGLIENDSHTVNRVRRLSRNPALLGAVRRFSISRSSNTTPCGSINRSISEDIRILDNAFSNSPRNSVRFSYTNKAFNNSLDGQESMVSSISRNQLTVPEIRIQPPSRRTGTADARSGSLRSMKSLNENEAV